MRSTTISPGVCPSEGHEGRKDVTAWCPAYLGPGEILTRINDSNNVLLSELKMLPSKICQKGTSDSNRKKFLPFDANPSLLIDEKMG